MMYIENRRKKEYSNKLFNELCVFSLLISSENEAYVYVLKNKLKISIRTLYRYINDLVGNGITPPIEIKKEIKYSYLNIPSISKEEYFSLPDCLENFILENKKIYNKDIIHKDKLMRLCLMIIDNINAFSNVDWFYEDVSKYDTPIIMDGETYAFESFSVRRDLYDSLSKRTLQREIKVVKKAIAYIYEF